jgi:hypothetical protein
MNGEPGSEILEAALGYLGRGWSVTACCPPDHVGIALVNPKHAKECDRKHWGKAPWHRWKGLQMELPPERDVRGWWRDLPNSNAGMPLGGVTGLIGLDVDEQGGEDLLRRLSGGDLPETLEFTSGRGRRLLYRVPAVVVLRPTPKPGGLEVETGELRLLGLGSQTVMPPSIHSSGRRYAWLAGHGPDDIKAALAPEWVVNLMRAERARTSPGKGNGRLEPDEVITEGNRDTRLTQLAGWMRRQGMTPDEIEAALLQINEGRCQPPLPDAQVAKIARSIGAKPAGVPFAVDPQAGLQASNIIRDYFRSHYQFVFRRGELAYSSSLQKDVRRTEACFGPTDALLQALHAAEDVPVDEKNTVRRSQLPGLFKKWAPTAWQNLMAELPEEGGDGQVVKPAEEDFRRLLSGALHTIVSLGEEIGTGKDAYTSVQRRSLIEWCATFAKPGPWQRVRSFLLWCRRDPAGLLGVALRADLFAQIGCGTLAKHPQRRFADLCETYAVGTGQECRPGGVRAVELSAEFIADLRCVPTLTEEQVAAYARGNDVSASTSEEVDDT